MVKIRLRRTGSKNKPQYRVVVADARSKRDGRFIEILGHYNPMTEPTATVKVHEDRALYWLSVGAQPTNTVKRLFTNMGVFEKFSRVRSGESIEEVVGVAQPPAEPDPTTTEAESNQAAEEPIDASETDDVKTDEQKA